MDLKDAAGGRGAIALRSVTKQYGAERVVDGIDIDIAPGEFFSLLGPSGSGKSTTLMMIAGFASVDGGEILVDGENIARTSPQKRNFGMVFQSYAIFPHMTVFENVAFPLRARGMRGAEVTRQVARALELVRLERFAKKYSRELSGGQQQRVAIARAIVFSPRVVLMDEPLGALDKNLRYDMQVEIKDLQRRLGMTVIYVTHDQEEAMNMSDRIAILNHGRIAQVGLPAAIYEKPDNRFVARFLGEANLIEGAVAADGCLTTPGGLALRTDGAQAIERGAPAALFIRPEKIALADPAGPGENQAAGVVRRRSFLGNMVRYGVEIDPQTLVTVDVANSGETLKPELGASVALRWRVCDCSILRN